MLDRCPQKGYFDLAGYVSVAENSSLAQYDKAVEETQRLFLCE